ncbi:DUF2922 domain-containing protein [Caldisericum exile]|uniref:DUF2922 domain-containing protein n=1 Tax=Caldisericum exile (strain DSM 21853 / NBRC 104410 / AZM16c01) TaxID=511051 RepID=A0A7U6GFQ1_CALEA|nr:DUF2922 domain-containing protein [Caldisericum exile]BAL81535.1 hypothetical protein CSE_14090 [Caldisericum exile AZM16c01]
MANITTKVLRLVFKTENGKTYAMEFANPKDTITSQKVETLGNLIVAKNIVTTKNGDLVQFVDGGIVERTFTDLVP